MEDFLKGSVALIGVTVGLFLITAGFILLYDRVSRYIRRDEILREEERRWLEKVMYKKEQEERLKAIEESRAREAAEAMRSLDRLILKMEFHLQAAEKLFSERAFGPFWDEIGDAAGCVAEYSDAISSLSTRDWRWDGKTKLVFIMTKTSWTPAELPNISTALGQMQKIIRIGQRDFEFASIYEQRRTQAILIEGFQNLQEVVQKTGVRVIDALKSLENNIRSELREVNYVLRENALRAAVNEQLILNRLASISASVAAIRW